MACPGHIRRPVPAATLHPRRFTTVPATVRCSGCGSTLGRRVGDRNYWTAAGDQGEGGWLVGYAGARFTWRYWDHSVRPSISAWRSAAKALKPSLDAAIESLD